MSSKSALSSVVTRPRGAACSGRSPCVATPLIRANLIDEYRLAIHPVVIDNRTSLFSPLPGPRRLDLVEARTLPSGTVIHTYRPGERARR